MNRILISCIRAYRRLRGRSKARYTQVVVVAGRSDLPTSLHPRRVYQLGQRGKWAVLDCPCGRGHLLELNMAQPGRPQWTLRENGAPSLFPSVDFRGERRCHFWLRDGRVAWVQTSKPQARGARASGNRS